MTRKAADVDNHYPPDTLDGGWFGRMTRAHWARSRATRAVVFVHGFGGDPVDTWVDFPTVLRGAAKLADCDLLFYGYDGLTTQANNSAAKFHDFLDRYLSNPAAVINTRHPVNVARPPFSYRTVVIAAHSLGAVVTRRALLRAHRARDRSAAASPWLPTVRIVLFAPAHNGAYAAEIAKSFLMSQGWWVAKVLGALGQLDVPLLNDLERRSELIANLRADTTSAAANATADNHLVAKRVLWAENELVVYNDEFFRDPEGDLQYGTNHFSVCKPDGFGHAAAQAVLEQL